MSAHLTVATAIDQPDPETLRTEIPERMQEARRWLLWRSIPQAGKKPRKVPFYAGGGTREATDTSGDSARLVDMETAVEAMARGDFSGIGFALGADGEGGQWQGVDLDGTTERPELSALVELLPGYVERSPSGNGFHAIGYGPQFPALGSNASGIEAYSAGRFFTVTADACGGNLEDLSPFVRDTLAPRHGPTKATEPTGTAPPVVLTSAQITELRSALNALPADDYAKWVAVGHALAGAGAVGRELWLTWSQTSDKYRPEDARKWLSFRGDMTGYQAVFAMAQRHGWVNPASKTAQVNAPEVSCQDGNPPAPSLSLPEAEELACWCLRTGTRIKDMKEIRIQVATGVYGPWPIMACQTGSPERFAADLETYLERREAKVDRENAEREAKGKEPQMDAPPEVLREHAVAWLARVQEMGVSDERGRELLARAAPGTAAGKPFTLTPVAELLNQPEPLRWLIPGYLIPECLALVFGDPAAGKSLLAIDWTASIATGRPWNGGRAPRKGPVIYIAGEGHFGIRRRFKAWAQHYKCETELRDAPLFVSDMAAAIGDPANVEQVAATVAAIAEEHGEPELIVIDTLHRNLGAGDENSSQDMAMFVKGADTLRERFKSAVLVVHHSGHMEKGRARGSSSLRAAVDTEFCLESSQSGDRAMTCTKMKDGPTPPPLGFELVQVELPWIAEDGTPETSVVLEPSSAPVQARFPALAGNVRLAFETLLEALEKRGMPPAENWHGCDPKPPKIVPLLHWRNAFYERHTGDNDATKRRMFNKGRTALTEAGSVSVWSGTYWATPEAGQWPQLVDVALSNAVVLSFNKKPNKDEAA